MVLIVLTGIISVEVVEASPVMSVHTSFYIDRCSDANVMFGVNIFVVCFAVEMT